MLLLLLLMMMVVWKYSKLYHVVTRGRDDKRKKNRREQRKSRRWLSWCGNADHPCYVAAMQGHVGAASALSVRLSQEKHHVKIKAKARNCRQKEKPGSRTLFHLHSWKLSGRGRQDGHIDCFIVIPGN